jgi:hypothetical protein
MLLRYERMGVPVPGKGVTSTFGVTIASDVGVALTLLLVLVTVTAVSLLLPFAVASITMASLVVFGDDVLVLSTTNVAVGVDEAAAAPVALLPLGTSTTAITPPNDAVGVNGGRGADEPLPEDSSSIDTTGTLIDAVVVSFDDDDITTVAGGDGDDGATVSEATT